LFAQAVFAARFVWQWIVSERRKESVVPVGFWYFSLAGGTMLTVYAIFRDPVLIPGQAAGLVVYVRNLILIRRTERAKRATNSAPCAEPSADSPIRRVDKRHDLTGPRQLDTRRIARRADRSR
jgi:lipid-A-disaccharide synthase-like uncharacterized protein